MSQLLTLGRYIKSQPSLHLHETYGETFEKSPKPANAIHWFLRLFQRVLWNDGNKSCLNKLKFLKFHKILNQAKSENVSCLSHVEPWNIPGSPKPGARWSGPLSKCFEIFFWIFKFIFQEVKKHSALNLY